MSILSINSSFILNLPLNGFPSTSSGAQFSKLYGSLRQAQGHNFLRSMNPFDKLRGPQGIDPQCYTFKKRPLQLVYSNYFQTPMQAIEFEKQIKRWSRKKKEALIKGDFRELIDLAKK